MTAYQYPLTDLQTRPDILLELLSQRDTAWVVQREDDQMVVRSYPTYSAETERLLTQAKALYQEKEAAGYSRENAIEDFNAALARIEQTSV